MAIGNEQDPEDLQAEDLESFALDEQLEQERLENQAFYRDFEDYDYWQGVE